MKIEATGKILILAQNENNLPEMADNDVLLSALARCLREDGLKSIELGTNIVHIFYIISHYQELGYPLLQHKAPESCFKMIEQENKRYSTFYNNLCELRDKVKQNNDANEKKKYQLEYDKFKKLCTTQDKLMFVAL